LLFHDKHHKGFQHKLIAESWIWGTLPLEGILSAASTYGQGDTLQIEGFVL
jgi:hypothetical protein